MKHSFEWINEDHFYLDAVKCIGRWECIHCGFRMSCPDLGYKEKIFGMLERFATVEEEGECDRMLIAEILES